MRKKKSTQTPRSKATKVLEFCICLYPAFPCNKEITTATEIHTVLMCQAL